MLENRGGSLLASAGDHPVFVLARFSRAGVDVPGTVGRARLSSVVGPGSAAEGLLRLPAPAEPGSYRLRVAVGQEGVGWFDDVDDGFVPWEGAVDVLADGGASPSGRDREADHRARRHRAVGRSSGRAVVALVRGALGR